MQKIKNFKNFALKDVFEIKKGNEITQINMRSNGYPVISTKSENNGYLGFYSRWNCEKVLTLASNGDCLNTFWQDKKSFANGDMVILKNKKLNSKNALFIKTIIEKNKFRYSYARKSGKNRIKDMKISLPINNNYQIDWEYMENFISNKAKYYIKNKLDPIFEHYKKRKYNSSVLNENKKWEYYKISDIFSVYSTKSINKNQLMSFQQSKYNIPHYTPYFTRTEKNNGISGFYKASPRQEKKTFAIGSVSNKLFYQEEQYIAGPYTLALHPKFKVNREIALFIVSVFNSSISLKYSFGNGIVKYRLEKEKIKLPTKNNEPYWKYMENYILKKEKEILINKENLIKTMFL